MQFRDGIRERFVTRDAATPAYQTATIVGGGEQLTRVLARFDPPPPDAYLRLEFGEGVRTGSGNSPVSSAPFEVVQYSSGPETAPFGNETHSMRHDDDPKLGQLQRLHDAHWGKMLSRDAALDDPAASPINEPEGERRSTLYVHHLVPGHKVELHGPDDDGRYALVLIQPAESVLGLAPPGAEADENAGADDEDWNPEHDAQGKPKPKTGTGDRGLTVRDHSRQLVELNRANAAAYRRR